MGKTTWRNCGLTTLGAVENTCLKKSVGYLQSQLLTWIQTRDPRFWELYPRMPLPPKIRVRHWDCTWDCTRRRTLNLGGWCLPLNSGIQPLLFGPRSSTGLNLRVFITLYGYLCTFKPCRTWCSKRWSAVFKCVRIWKWHKTRQLPRHLIYTGYMRYQSSSLGVLEGIGSIACSPGHSSRRPYGFAWK